MKKKMTPRKRRHVRVRKKLFGTAERPRLNVFRSHKHIYVQAVDDLEKRTIASASSLISDLPSVEEKEGETLTNKRRVAKAVGKMIAAKLQEKGVNAAIFDRGGYLYHGRVRALADGAREGGLAF